MQQHTSIHHLHRTTSQTTTFQHNNSRYTKNAVQLHHWLAMQNKKSKVRGWNILLGIFVVLGLSFEPSAFDIRFYNGVSSRKCSFAGVTTQKQPSVIIRNDNPLTRVQVCSQNPSKDEHNSSSPIEVQTIASTTNQRPVSWFAMILLLLAGKAISTSSNNLSVLGVGATLAALVPHAAVTTIGPAKFSFLSITPQQAAILGSSLYATFRIISLHARSVSSWYMGLLEFSPLLTKTITTATIGILGDTTAQYFETRALDSHEESAEQEKMHKGTRADHNTRRSWLHNYDRRRGLSVFGENILISGPLLHFAYNWMESILPTTFGGSSAIIAALGQALIDNFVLDTIFLALAFISTGIAEGFIRELPAQFRKDFVPTLTMGWVTGLCLIPIQFCLFRFMPLSLRVLGVNCIDVFWEAYVSYMIHRRRREAASAK